MVEPPPIGLAIGATNMPIGLAIGATNMPIGLAIGATNMPRLRHDEAKPRNGGA